MQALINRAEGLPPPEPTFDDHFAAHLDTQAHPLPHPKRFDMGYVKLSTFKMPDYSQMTRRADRGDAAVITHPGPITMEDTGNWNWGAIAAVVAIVVVWTSPWWVRLFK